MHVVAVGGGDHEHIGKDERMGRFDVTAVAGKDPLFLNPRPGGMHHQLEIELVQRPIVIRSLVAAAHSQGMGMKIIGMDRIHRVLHRLQPVAAQGLINLQFSHSIPAREHVPSGQQRFFLRRSQVGEQEPRQFLHGVRRLRDFIFETGLGIFERLFQTLAAGVVLPAMIGAADAILLDKSVVKRHAAVGAVLGDESVVAPASPIEQQIFPEDPDLLFWFFFGDLGCRRDNVPVAPQQFAGRCTGTGACEQFVFFSREHGPVLSTAVQGFKVQQIVEKSFRSPSTALRTNG